MTIADFLHQAGFWQWIGIIALVAAASNFRFFTITNTAAEKAEKETP